MKHPIALALLAAAASALALAGDAPATAPGDVPDCPEYGLPIITFGNYGGQCRITITAVDNYEGPLYIQTTGLRIVSDEGEVIARISPDPDDQVMRVQTVPERRIGVTAVLDAVSMLESYYD